MFNRTQFHLEDQVVPLIFHPSDFRDSVIFKELYHNNEVGLVDELDNQVGELIKAINPSSSFSKRELSTLVEQFFLDQERDSYGNWVYFPWKKVLVRLLPEEDFIRVRTIRNNYKITPSEQDELATKKVGIVGLSVGQSVALAMALERSCGEMRLADFDTLELSNLNRLKAGVTSLGEEKIIIAAREISEIDPYLKLTLYREGITPDNIDDFINKGGKLDLLVDECDSLDIKVLLREKAKANQVPVMMDTSDRGMLDVERFDLEPERELFHGAMGNVDVGTLKDLTTTQKVAIGLKITGLESLSPRMKASLLEVGQTITSWPQLASAVFLGGGTVAHSARKLFLGDSVNSGRYYVDLDQILDSESTDLVQKQNELVVNKDAFSFNIPGDVLPSGYLLNQEEVHQLVESANLAPSGGNVQPWIWIFDRKGVLHLFHDQARSHSLLDFLGTGSLIAFGAALENLRLASAEMGIEIEIIDQINVFEDDCIASIRFISKSKEPLIVPFGELVEGIGIRCTNRKNGEKQYLTSDQVNEFINIATHSGFELEMLEQESDLEKLSEILGGMDRMRLFHEQGLKDFIHEVRWSDKEAKETKDGIDIATLELSGTERAAMGLLKDPRTVSFFRKFLMGFGLTKISKQTLTSSSAVFLLNGKENSPETYLKAGEAIQRIWINSNLQGLSFQPVTASLFIFNKILKDKNHGFTRDEERIIKELKTSFNTLLNKNQKMEEIFMFRINMAGEPSMRSYRRDVSESLMIL
ncbi:Rv1355c family protein [Algoriphagus sp. C2-6-M1]|uniref:Rv1355c family protein n=1 Tax=Algoriphagus persicinus TaxID=3108754 RepID=UPI002B372669|nr:Rv1355c family protein [Algoriphagus sp. C2-6-M1]MEB2781951.1 Rv1355c family protein [Algoriphagus sp. C2-6-M1]